MWTRPWGWMPRTTRWIVCGVEVYERLLAAADGFEPGQAMDAALIARYYERLADHAVSVGRCMAFRAGRAGLDPTPQSVGPGQDS